LVWLVSLKDGSRLRGRTSGISEVLRKKVLMGTADFAEVLALADIDIDEIWERYRARYFRRLKR